MEDKPGIFAFFSFFGDLLELLPSTYEGTKLRLEFAPHQSIKHLVESLRIPHTEIGKLLVNGQPAPLSQILRNGDIVQVYPVEPGALDGHHSNAKDHLCQYSDPQSVIDPPSFLLDNHLGKLASHLRMLGFDTLYRNNFQDKELATLAQSTGRVLLTRDRGLLMRKQVNAGYCLRSLDPQQQLRAVIRRYALIDRIRPFRRCMRCNGELEDVAKADVFEQILPLTRQYYDEFRRCTTCGQVYWKGSHYQKMMQFIEGLRQGDV